MASLGPKADEILNAATSLIQKRGYNGFSFRDIATEVGIRSASIHYHFPTKSDLVTSATLAYREAFMQTLESINESQSSGIKRLKAYGDVFLSTLNTSGKVCLCGMLAGESETLPDELRLEVESFFDEQRAWLVSVIGQGQADGNLIGSVDASQFAITYLSALEGAMIIARGLSRPQILSDTIKQQLAFVEIK